MIVTRDHETMKSNLKRRLAGETGRPALGGSERTHKKSCRKSLWQSNLRTGMLAWLISEPLTHPYMWPIMERSIQGWSKVASFTRSANLHLAGWHARKEGNIRLIMSKKQKTKNGLTDGKPDANVFIWSVQSGVLYHSLVGKKNVYRHVIQYLIYI